METKLLTKEALISNAKKLTWIVMGFVILSTLSTLLAEDGYHVGGALRWNYFYKDWKGQEHNQNTFGALGFDTFRLNVDGTYKGLIFSAEYRFYAGYSMIHHGWLGYDFSECTQMQLGVHQVPFGILKYASHNWFFQIPYYVGLEDDYDAGIKLVHKKDNYELDLAFYKNCEGSYTGSSSASARYSYDVVPENTHNQENNQFNVRAVYNLNATKIGVSGQAGQIYNSSTEENGMHTAFAGHVNSTFGPVNIKTEAIYYNYDLENPSGVSEEVVEMGAYDYPYNVASEAMMYVFGISYGLPVSWGPISKLTFYENYSYLDKTNEDFYDTHHQVLGVMITAGGLYTYFDIASGKNNPWLGPQWSNALGQGVESAGWHTRVNLNIGYYF